MPQSSSTKKPFKEHLDELRSRLFWSVITLLIGACIGYFFHEQLLTILLRPLHQTVYYSSPTGGLDFIFKICLFFGVIISLPVFTYNILRFIQPVFPKHITGLFMKIILSSYILMLCGISFAYFINLPAALHFFNEFSSGQIHALISTDEYLSFVMTDLFGFGLVFQMPLILLFINTLQPISIKWLFKQEKYVIVISFLAGALLTPDPVNQTIMAVPIFLLYQISIGILFLQNRKRKIPAVFVIFIAFIVIVSIAFGSLFVMQSVPHFMSRPAPTPTPKPNIVPTHIPTPTIAFMQKKI